MLVIAPEQVDDGRAVLVHLGHPGVIGEAVVLLDGLKLFPCPRQHVVPIYVASLRSVEDEPDAGFRGCIARYGGRGAGVNENGRSTPE